MGVQIQNADDVEAASTFTFHALKPFASLETSKARDLLKKWNLDDLKAHSFRFDQPFVPQQLHAFLTDFFNDETVQSMVPVCTGRGSWGSLGKVSDVQAERLCTTVLRLDFFDRLSAAGVTHQNGMINKCFDVQCGDVLASDKLRLMLLDESSEEWDVYSAAERKELIFHVMQRLATGGGLNQYEDSMEPYLDLAKGLYKDLVSVQKDGAGQLQVRSLALQVNSASSTGAPLFPRDTPHNFCYVTIDPLQRHVKYWYFAWFPGM